MGSLSLRSVAEDAQVPLSAIRYYFGSREGLLVEAVTALDAERARTADEALRVANDHESGIGNADAATLILRSLYGDRLDDDGMRGTLGWVFDSSRESPALTSALARQRPPLERQIHSILEATGHARVSAALVISVIDGSVVLALSEGRTDLRETATRQLVELFDQLPSMA